MKQQEPLGITEDDEDVDVDVVDDDDDNDDRRRRRRGSKHHWFRGSRGRRAARGNDDVEATCNSGFIGSEEYETKYLLHNRLLQCNWLLFRLQ